MNTNSPNKRKQKIEMNVEIENLVHFTQIANETVRNKNLTGLEKAILLLVLSHNQEKFTISRRTLFNSFADSQHMIRKSLIGLKSKNYLKIERTFAKWIYKVNHLGLPYHNGTVADNVSQADCLSPSQHKNNNIKNTKGVRTEPKIEVGKEYQGNEEKTENTLTQVQIEIQEEMRILHEENEKLLAIQRQPKQQKDFPPSPIYSSEQLLGKSNEFIQKIGFGFTNNPRHVLDSIYKHLPEDYQVKEDPKDIELVKSAINQYNSSPSSERDALSKKFYNTVENMAKLYLIKKHGEEFRDKLYPELLNKNLILYLSCNPTFKYCHGGFSNDIDGVYSEITRIVRKKIEKQKAEYEKDRERVIERERVKEVMLNRPNLSDDQIHAMGLRTVPEIIEAMNKRNCDTNIELLDEKYRPIIQLDERDKLREEELLRIMVSGTKLSMDEQLEFDILRRKKAVG
jgi:hypothetical protein